MSVFDFWAKGLNQESLSKYKKYTFILGAASLSLKLVTEFPFFEIVFFIISVFLIVVSVKALYNEKFRPLVINGSYDFENTKYILYFLIYTGVFGMLLVGWYLFAWFLSKI